MKCQLETREKQGGYTGPGVVSEEQCVDSPVPNWSKLVGQVNVQGLDSACLSGEMKQVVAADALDIDFNVEIRSEVPPVLVGAAA